MKFRLYFYKSFPWVKSCCQLMMAYSYMKLRIYFVENNKKIYR